MKEILVAAALSVLATAAFADVQISMQPGSQCWSYQGLDSRFFGNFSGGQALTVAVVEEVVNEKGGKEAIAYSAEKVWVNGPSGYYKDGNREEPNDRVIFTEKPGRYIFNLYEHGTGAVAPVFVKICAKKNDQR